MAKPNILEGSGAELAAYIKKHPGERFRLVPLTAPQDKEPAEDDPLLALFAQWEQEDAGMTPEEVLQETREWDEFKARVNAERASAGARKVF